MRSNSDVIQLSEKLRAKGADVRKMHTLRHGTLEYGSLDDFRNRYSDYLCLVSNCW